MISIKISLQAFQRVHDGCEILFVLACSLTSFVTSFCFRQNCLKLFAGSGYVWAVDLKGFERFFWLRKFRVECLSSMQVRSSRNVQNPSIVPMCSIQQKPYKGQHNLLSLSNETELEVLFQRNCKVFNIFQGIFMKISLSRLLPWRQSVNCQSNLSIKALLTSSLPNCIKEKNSITHFLHKSQHSYAELSPTLFLPNTQSYSTKKLCKS